MEVGTRFRVIGPLTAADLENDVRIGDTGITVERGDVPWCKMDRKVSGRRIQHKILGIPVGYAACLIAPRLEPIPNKPRKRQEPTDTSRQALQSQKDKAPSDCAKILEYLKTHVTGRTCDHVERVLRMSHQTASARIRDLAASGKIMDSGRREATRTGRKAICWKAVEA